ncbi:hypothetical protein [Candidatus Binatus sp.]|jgi:4-amino-4-deoxy-L-arabinose transferase-like glycosyltransferase|uniref:hypothetical protein n=1 Tax=Candidatus Binatus sp. TaxID=2811406 RepID=UPI003BD391F4
MRTRGQAAWLVLIGIAALLIRLAPLARHDLMFQTGWDAADYIPLAEGIEHGCGFARLVNGHCGSPNASRPPGYPYFVALMPNLRTVLVIQAILGATLCVWLGWFVSGRWGIRAGLLAETLLTIDIPTIVYGAMIMSEATFQFLLTGAILLQLSAIIAAEWTWRATARGIAAAVMLAAAAMIRPTGILLPLFAPIPFLISFRRTNWLRASIFMVLAFVIAISTILAWIARNRAVAGVSAMDTDSAGILYYYDAAGVLSYATHRNFFEVEADLRRRSEETHVLSTGGILRDSLEIFVQHPIATAVVIGRGLIYVAMVPARNELNELIGPKNGGPLKVPPSSDVLVRVRQVLHSPTLTALVLVQLLLIGFIWLGVARALLRNDWMSKRQTALLLIPLAIALIMLGCAAGPDAHSRFRVPAIPFLAMLAGIGWLGLSKDREVLAQGGFVSRIASDRSIAY